MESWPHSMTLKECMYITVFLTQQTSIDTCICTYMCACNALPSIFLLCTSYSNATSVTCHPNLLVEIFFHISPPPTSLPHTLMVCAVLPDPCKVREMLKGLLFTSVGTQILPNENICLCSSHAQLAPKRNVLINFFFKS